MEKRVMESLPFGIVLHAYTNVKYEICMKSIWAVRAYTVNPISVTENVTKYHPFDL